MASGRPVRSTSLVLYIVFMFLPSMHSTLAVTGLHQLIRTTLTAGSGKMRIACPSQPEARKLSATAAQPYWLNTVTV